MTPTNAHMYKKFRSHLQRTATCFGQLRGRHQGYKIRILDTLHKYYTSNVPKLCISYL